MRLRLSRASTSHTHTHTLTPMKRLPPASHFPWLAPRSDFSSTSPFVCRLFRVALANVAISFVQPSYHGKTLKEKIFAIRSGKCKCCHAHAQSEAGCPPRHPVRSLLAICCQLRRKSKNASMPGLFMTLEAARVLGEGAAEAWQASARSFGRTTTTTTTTGPVAF